MIEVPFGVLIYNISRCRKDSGYFYCASGLIVAILMLLVFRVAVSTFFCLFLFLFCLYNYYSYHWNIFRILFSCHSSSDFN